MNEFQKRRIVLLLMSGGLMIGGGLYWIYARQEPSHIARQDMQNPANLPPLPAKVATANSETLPLAGEAPDKTAEKTGEKTSEKAGEQAGDKSDEKTAEKAGEKTDAESAKDKGAIATTTGAPAAKSDGQGKEGTPGAKPAVAIGAAATQTAGASNSLASGKTPAGLPLVNPALAGKAVAGKGPIPNIAAANVAATIQAAKPGMPPALPVAATLKPGQMPIPKLGMPQAQPGKSLIPLPFAPQSKVPPPLANAPKLPSILPKAPPPIMPMAPMAHLQGARLPGPNNGTVPNAAVFNHSTAETIKAASEAGPAPLPLPAPNAGAAEGSRKSIAATTRDTAASEARTGAGRTNPFMTIAGYQKFPRVSDNDGAADPEGRKPMNFIENQKNNIKVAEDKQTKGAKSANDKIASSAGGAPPKHRLLPPPPPPMTMAPPAMPGAGKSGASAAGGSQLSLDELPAPPSRPSIADKMQLVGVIGDSVVLTINKQVARQNKWPFTVTLGLGKKFETLSVVSISPDSVTLEEDGQKMVKTLPPIR